MTELVGYPVTQPLFALVTVIVDEDGPAGQVREHQTAVPCGNVQAKDSRVIQVLPMWDKEHSQRKNLQMSCQFGEWC